MDALESRSYAPGRVEEAAMASRDKALRERAARVIPGGMYGHQSVAALPQGYPQFFSRVATDWWPYH